MALDRNVRLAGSDQVGVTVGELVDEIVRQAMEEIEKDVLAKLRAAIANTTVGEVQGPGPT